MLSKARMCRTNFLDGTANPPGHRRSSTFRGIPQLSVATSQSRCTGQLVNDRVEFYTSRFGAGGIVVEFSLFDFLLQFLNAPTILATCLFVEHVSGGIEGSRLTRQFQTMQRLVGLREQSSNVVKTFQLNQSRT
jgi:hypothetical protein